MGRGRYDLIRPNVKLTKDLVLERTPLAAGVAVRVVVDDRQRVSDRAWGGEWCLITGTGSYERNS